MLRRSAAVALGLLPAVCLGQPLPQTLTSLTDPGQWAAWSSNISTWRSDTLVAMGYTEQGALAYAVAGLGWAESATVFYSVPAFDRRLYDPISRNFTGAQFIQKVESQLGPIDTLVLWFSLPASGIDARNQWQWIDSVPGGMPAVRNLVAEIALLGVRVLLGYLPWDSGTTPDAGSAAATGALLNATADGLLAFDAPSAGLDAALFSVNATDGGATTYFALCSDSDLPLRTAVGPHPLGYTPLSRSQALAQPSTLAPGGGVALPFSAFRTIERRHTAIAGAETDLDRRDAILAAWVNGGGVLVADNAFGFTNALSARDAELLFRAGVLGRFVAVVARSGNWSGVPPSEGTTGAVADPLPDGAPTDLGWLPQFPYTSTSGSVVASQFYAACPSNFSFGGVEGVETMPNAARGAPRTALARQWREALLSWRAQHSPTAGSNEPNCTVFLFANFAPPGTMEPASITFNTSLAFLNNNNTVSPALYMVDLYHGAVLGNATAAPDPSTETISLSILPGDIGAVLVTPLALTPSLLGFLTFCRENVSAVNITSFPNAWSPAPQGMSGFTPTSPFSSPPAGMLLVQGMAGYAFAVNASPPYVLQQRSGGSTLPPAASAGSDVQYPWESAPQASHNHTLDVPPFYLDANLVTNEAFLTFLQLSGYNASLSAPQLLSAADHIGDRSNFLRHWVQYPNGTVSFNDTTGDGPRPVVWVSLQDAAAFCGWLGRRLPLEWEWSFGAQALADGGSTDYRPYPWGAASCSGTPDACPMVDSSRSPRPPDAVGAHPSGASALGIQDFVGNVWQLMSHVWTDGTTRAVVLRGGSFYSPQSTQPGPQRYFPSGDTASSLLVHARLPFGDDSGTRSGQVGFRCAADTPSSASAHFAARGA